MNGHLTGAFAAPLATLVRGEGCYVWDESGKRYLDFLGGIAVNALGHANPALVAAVTEQIGTLGHISNLFVSKPQIELADRLCALADLGPGSNVFFSNSGAEANEAALKMIRLHGSSRGKHQIIALKGAFHGRTMGALALTAKVQYRAPFAPLLAEVRWIEPTSDALKQSFTDEVAAVVVEPILGEAGVVDLPTDFLRTVREITGENDALMVVDEVQTGMGRTGAWFAHHRGNSGVRADIVTLAKGLGGGIPIGATVAGPVAAGLFTPGSHGSTFGGNPLACRAALTVIDTISRDSLLENASTMGAAIREAVVSECSEMVSGTSGDGLLIGIHLRSDCASVLAAELFSEGVIVNAPTPNILRLAPPLIVGERQLQEFLSALKQSLTRIQAKLQEDHHD